MWAQKAVGAGGSGVNLVLFGVRHLSPKFSTTAMQLKPWQECLILEAWRPERIRVNSRQKETRRGVVAKGGKLVACKVAQSHPPCSPVEKLGHGENRGGVEECKHLLHKFHNRHFQGNMLKLEAASLGQVSGLRAL